MTKEQAHKEFEKLIQQKMEEVDKITQEAKEKGTWCEWGLDSNNHLFKELNQAYKEKFEALIAMIED